VRISTHATGSTTQTMVTQRSQRHRQFGTLDVGGAVIMLYNYISYYVQLYIINSIFI